MVKTTIKKQKSALLCFKDFQSIFFVSGEWEGEEPRWGGGGRQSNAPHKGPGGGKRNYRNMSFKILLWLITT